MYHFKWAGIFAVIILLQSTIVQLLAIKHIYPDFILVVLFLYALNVTQIPATVMGFSVGLAGDLLNGGSIIGLSALTKSVVGFLLGFQSKREKPLRPPRLLMLFVGISLFHDTIFHFLNTLGGSLTVVPLMIRYSLPTTLYSTCFVAMIFAVQRRI